MNGKSTSADRAAEATPEAEAVKTDLVSSPASTGGAGHTFEQHVGAYWLTQLLVGAIPPVFIDTTVSAVSFQTELLGWHTDDFLVICERGDGPGYRLVGQVKRSFTLSASDEECTKAIGDFWKDFNGSQFSKANDRLVLVTQRGTNTLLEHFAGLLDCARSSNDAAEFERRLSTAGFISSTAIRYCSVLRDIIGGLEGRPITTAELWPFLRALHVLSLDLFTATGQVEAQMKTLLAHTAKQGVPVAAAAASWNALVIEASAALPQARTLRRGDLPAALRDRHSPIGTTEQNVLRALKDHTEITLDNIRATIGDAFHLQRASLVQKVLQALEDVQIVLIAGPAGSGKSAVGKDAVAALSPEHFAFGFRVEEFAQPHFDATLHAAQVPANAAALRAILAAQGRKVILVESVERLLERTTRDAFSDLMVLARADAATRIILTCRDYSVDLVRASFLQPARIKYDVVQVPPLDDTELALVESAHPALAIPLKHTALRDILRNPFFLDKALEIEWSVEKPVPQSEREFRLLFWREIVRADHRVAAGMGRRREDALEDIAVRRARALSPYVPANNLDPGVVEALRHDSLITSPDGTPLLVATAHDVLEDWAILQWLEEQRLTGVGSFEAWSKAIGTHPAIRRSYRKWVGELVERHPAAADNLFAGAITETAISVQFRDDTLVALLKAPTAPAFLARHEAELLANDRAILKRAIHLLRVACVKTPPWFEGAGPLFSVPDGRAWAAVLHLVQGHLTEFAADERLLLLGLIEDWASGVSVWTPYPKGAVAAAAVAHRLLPEFDTYRDDGAGQRILKIIAKIPRAAPEPFEILLRGEQADRDGRRTSEEFRDMIFSGMEGVPVARDLPDLLVAVAQTYLFCTQEELEREFRGSSLGVELNFGLKENLHHGHFPASAYRGPWLPLLRYHPERGIDLFVSVFNHSADWYAHPRVHDRLESAFQITLTFADGTTQQQWVNGRLWNLYRGTSVAPYVLQSMAMALERWLLELAESSPDALDATLLGILRRSESGALTAVVASIATAFPYASGETLLVLLTALVPIRLDSYRVVGESQAPSGLHGMFPRARGADEIYQREREESDRLPHRRTDLESAILNLQLGPLAPRVHQILDAHRAALPAEGQRSEEDKVWLLALGRMDLRQYSVGEEVRTDELHSDDKETPRAQLRLDPKPQDADVQQMVNENAEKFAATNARLALLMWGLTVFERDHASTIDPMQWRSRLAQAMTLDFSTLAPTEMAAIGGAPAVVAAVCVRDHWDELTSEEQAWCLERISTEVTRDADTWDQLTRVQRYSMSADRSCASVVPLLIGKELRSSQRALVEQAFVRALTHPIAEVQWYAVWGIARQLWAFDPPLTIRCVNAIAHGATLIDQAREVENQKPYGERKATERIEAETAALIRKHFWTQGAIPEDAHMRLDLDDWFGADASARILAILGEAPTQPVSIAAYARSAEKLAAWWDDHDNRRYDRGSTRRERNHETESAVSEFIQKFVLRTTREAAATILRPILDTVDRPSRDLHWFVRGLTAAEDQLQKTEQFWTVWALFADKIRRARWVAKLSDRYSSGDEVSSAIFLGSFWKDDVRHWRSLEGHVGLVDDLFDDLPPSSTILDDYVRFLYHIGERSLPQAFVRINRKLHAGDFRVLLEKPNTMFMLESLLQRYVYGRPLELKTDASVRAAVLDVLDMLVENGSSAAFRMRDDFVTPAA